MAKFATKEWFEAFIHVLRGDQEYLDAVKEWDKTILLIIRGEADSDYIKEDENLIAFLDIYKGDVRDPKLFETEDVEADFVFEMGVNTFEAIAKGEVNVVTALGKGDVAVKGDMTYLLEFAEGLSKFNENLTNVPTEW
ncbi:MAG: SCP2 sterol-binding domain-containing protein [Candidatus Lokiarchaeia archaeon]